MSRDQIPSTERCWWKRRRDDIIDVTEIKPNPVIKWLKDNWKRTFAVLITRIGRCWDRTEPGAYMMLMVGIMLGIMFSVFPYMANDRMPTMFQTVKHATWMSLWLSFWFEAFLYGMWEMIQGFKALHRWAGKHYQEARHDR